MFNTRMDYQICEYMVYCRSRQLREKQWRHTNRLFGLCCHPNCGIFYIPEEEGKQYNVMLF